MGAARKMLAAGTKPRQGHHRVARLRRELRCCRWRFQAQLSYDRHNAAIGKQQRRAQPPARHNQHEAQRRGLAS